MELSEIQKREAVRAVLLTPEGKVLLIQIQEPASGFRLWLTPGGGMGPDEKPEDCLRRELREETGLGEFRFGPPLWTREHTFSWVGRRIRQRETYYLVRTDQFEPTMNGNPEKVEIDAFRGFRWWTTPEIHGSNELFVPQRLGELLDDLIRHGPPEEPVRVGI